MTLALLLLQIASILSLCRLLHGIAGRFGQPPVVGEIIAGLLLGPSFFGWIAPALYARLFPAASGGLGGSAQHRRFISPGAGAGAPVAHPRAVVADVAVHAAHRGLHEHHG